MHHHSSHTGTYKKNKALVINKQLNHSVITNQYEIASTRTHAINITMAACVFLNVIIYFVDVSSNIKARFVSLT